MRDAVIVGFLRSAQSRSRPNDPPRDWFYKLRADELLAKLLPEVIKKTGIKAEEIDDFIVGSAYGVSEQWSYGGRFPIFLANLPEKIPAKFVASSRTAWSRSTTKIFPSACSASMGRISSLKNPSL